MFKRTLVASALALAATAALLPAQAQTSEKPPLKIVVGFPPGGSADLLARLLAEGLKNDFSSVIVENKPGAGGRIALGHVKRAPADGQTVVLLPSGPMVLFPHVYKKLDYDAVTDFTPISLLAHFQFSVVAGPSAGVKNVAEMLAKAAPGKSTYGTPGQGTLPHFMGVMFGQKAGAELTHVPFQGGGPANTALLGGHIDYKFDVVTETAELHRAGKVRIIAVTGAQRDPQVPEVPTLKEQGVDMEATAWFAMYGPAGLKPEVRDMLSAAVAKAVRTPALKTRLLEQGYEPVGSTPAELAAAQKTDLQRWAGPIKATGIQLD
ncbi:Bug family tripartite tricarboxylate transporter substrate binding protein [Hydrogenophaga taeniospiralis]|uniref:Bug family tripartite tricarboxylate transporter substrate binding protein n=1 Tax=Hydrogenophaga taeniospiralis TaxID=65656 RepID=UPI001CFB3236|nr:Bug family tripartite tricarboxylate transporter substrate binding protein [Hydrogenophaga taeniospiralis]UCU94810.1 Bug family tripartite tricarboxylate transporter substrate binding protein [Hydrogenophaga taeniospiralis]